MLRHLARPFVAAAPTGVRGERGDGLGGELTLLIRVDHADDQVSISWSTATLADPVVTGTCVRRTRWQADEARLYLELEAGRGCTVTISAEPLWDRFAPTSGLA